MILVVLAPFIDIRVILLPIDLTSRSLGLCSTVKKNFITQKQGVLMLIRVLGQLHKQHFVVFIILILIIREYTVLVIFLG